jgi:hypothetical protein|uniref:Uncharacterized protein n=1 Tax=Myoviridae sp. ctshb19 TaxID=2825194 RepID=A0A8S5UG99_9CAUD|nr:MAG TPA: hypothetical protein [Myoviridae sp. ctshb19]
MASKDFGGLVLLRPEPHIVTFRFASPDMEARFKFRPSGARRGREQIQHDLRDFWRNEVLTPAMRFCWRAQQPEYQIEGNLPDQFWKSAQLACQSAIRECWVYFDGGFVTVQMAIFAHPIDLLARKDMQKLTGAIEAAIGTELSQLERELISYKDTPDVAPDKYEVWRERVYRDIQRGLMDDFFSDGVLLIQPRTEAHILGKEPE